MAPKSKNAITEKTAKMRAAKAAKAAKALASTEAPSEPTGLDASSGSNGDINSDDDDDDIHNEWVTRWPGGVLNHCPESDNSEMDSDFVLTDSDDGSDSEWEDLEMEEMDPEEMMRNELARIQQRDEEMKKLKKEVWQELEAVLKPTPYEVVTAPSGSVKRDQKKWKLAEKHLRSGVNLGNAARTKRYQAQKARRKAESDATTRKGQSANFMRMFLSQTPPSSAPSPPTSSSDNTRSLSPDEELPATAAELCNKGKEPIFEKYLSDDDDLDDEESDTDSSEPDTPDHASDSEQSSRSASLRAPAIFCEPTAPPSLKRRRTNGLTVRKSKKQHQAARKKAFEEAFVAITKLVQSKKTEFEAGPQALQARRARAIESTLSMIVKRKRGLMDASRIAAEAGGFSPEWGSLMVRKWVREWMREQELPTSHRGSHAKVYSLLSDPIIRSEIHSYLRSNKWAMSPAKCLDFLNNRLLPDQAKEYARHASEIEMPNGLKKYIEETIIPRHGFRVKKGLSLTTACSIIIEEGFKYMEHKKAPYFDGHKRPNNVQYRQTEFIPEFYSILPSLVEWVAGDVEKKKEKELPDGAQWTVLCAHDEMVAQANDGLKASWVLNGEMPIKKKGVGRGIHRSDVLCSSHGWMSEAGEQIEYGKNHDGYWNGEMFVTQLKEKIIPAFERLHPGMRACILIDNSQGHSTYAEDALVASHHPSHPNEPKGMKAVLEERGLYRYKLVMKCKGSCPDGSTTCCARQILKHQPNFQQQRSLVHEVIESAGHICLMLPKYHCELNFIEFFWGAVKRYLREHCKYTFEALRSNMPKALASVDVKTIRKWEHRTHRWIAAYKDGLEVKDAQKKVRDFSSTKYKSHCRVPERVAQLFDV